MAGEDQHDKGRDGLLRAKRWLDRSTRVAMSWTTSDRPYREFLHFDWPDGSTTFSFDLGGALRGGPLSQQTFIAEVKNYDNESDLPAHFRAFLAKCYVAFLAKPDRCDHFMWISWAPFKAQTWSSHTSRESVQTAILHTSNRYRVLGTDDDIDALGKIDHEAMSEVSRRIWMITLCKSQEQLVISDEHMGKLMEYMQVSKGGVWE